MPTVWGRSNSINVQKVLWCCEELGLACRRIDAGAHFGVTDTPAFRKLNPNRLVPALDDGSMQLWESNVIVRYLCHEHSRGGLFPSDTAIRFDAERWMDWQATVFWPALRPLFIALIRTAARDRDVNVIKMASTACVAAAEILNERLSDREFICGNEFTMGDIPIGATVHRWYALEILHPSLPCLERWYRTLQRRPAFQSTVMSPLS